MKDCKYCGFPMEVHDREHLATECYPKQIDALRVSLIKYGRHIPDGLPLEVAGQTDGACPAIYCKGKCVCGLEEALQQSPRKGRK